MTPLHPSSMEPKKTPRFKIITADDDVGVSCNKCRPHPRTRSPSSPSTPPPPALVVSSAPSSTLPPAAPPLQPQPANPMSGVSQPPSSPPNSSTPLVPFLRTVSDSRLDAATRPSSRSSASSPSLTSAPSPLNHPPRSLPSHRPLPPYHLRLQIDRTPPLPILLLPSTPKPLILFLWSLLNRVFYSNFEIVLNSEPLDPLVRCEANRKGYEAVRELTWGEMLSHGTSHYSEGLSRFCYRRMEEIVGILDWRGSAGAGQRAWPEGLLQAFFGAAKGVWLVHLLALSVHPPVPLLRVTVGAPYEPDFMKDVAGSGQLVNQ